VRSAGAAEQTRGAFLHSQQQRFYDSLDAADAARTAPRVAWNAWDATRLERESTYMAENRDAVGMGERDSCDLESGGYEQVALALMRAIARDERTTLILNVRGRGRIPALDDDAVIEVPCHVDANGARSERTIWPIAIVYFDDVRVLAGWCEHRSAFRHFRLDRVEVKAISNERYPGRRQSLITQWKEQDRDWRSFLPISVRAVVYN
jgi:hypothetical protein